MEDQTQITKKPETKPITESAFGGISMRGWLTFVIVLTVCFMSIMKIGIAEPLYTMATIVVGFYFGQNKQSTAVKPTEPTKQP
jgi:hypothetical protein